MKKNAFLMIAALAMAGCSAMEPGAPEVLTSSTITITASREGCGVSKTELQEDGGVMWSDGDKIQLVWSGGSAESEALSLSSPAETATFKVTVPDGVTPLYAVYPSTVAASCSGSALTVTLPASSDGSFEGAAIEAAELSSDGSAALKNVGAMLSVEVTSADVTGIVVSANGGKAIAGKATVAFEGGLPVIGSTSETASSVTVLASGAGTYYIPVLPASCSEGFSVQIKGGDATLGQKFTGKAYDFERSKLYNLGAITVSDVSGLFVKVDGTGDGSSWDSAMGWSDLQNLIKNGPLTGNVYMAGGTYAIAADITVKAASHFSIYGGFNPASSGADLSDRDTEAFVTAFDGGGAKRLFVYNNATSEDNFDGVTFQNAYKSSSDVGSVLIFQNCKGATLNNCVIKNNKKEGSGGGVIRLNKGTFTFTGCTFSGNTSAGNAGVFAAAGSGTSLVTVTMEDCVFSGNTAGATASVLYVVNNAHDFVLNRCVFQRNTSGRMGAIATGHPNGKILLNACSFYGNTTSAGASAIYTKGKTAIYNCAFDANTTAAGGETPATIYNDFDSAEGKLLIANTSIRVSDADGVGVWIAKSPAWVVNSIVVNTASASAAAVRTEKEMTSFGHSFCSVLEEVEEGTYVLENASDQDAIFAPELLWNGEGNYLVWDVTALAPPSSFTLATAARVEAAIDAYDEAAGTAVKDRLTPGVDIRGIARNAAGFWPGCYDNGVNETF